LTVRIASDAAAVFGVEPDRQIELPVALQDGRCIGAAKRGLNDGVDVRRY